MDAAPGADATGENDAKAAFDSLKTQICNDVNAMLSEHQVRLHAQLIKTLTHYSERLGQATERSDKPVDKPVDDRPRTSKSSIQSAASSHAPARPQRRTLLDDSRRDIRKSMQSEKSRRSTFSNHERVRKKKALNASTSTPSMLADQTPEDEIPEDPHRVPAGSSARAWVRDLMDAAYTDHFFSIVIMVYIAGMGLEVEASSPISRDSANVIQNTCNFFFTIELVLRLIGQGCSDFFCGRGMCWNILDFVFVFMFVFEILLLVSSSSFDGALNNMMMLRMVRLVRIVRILRAIRVLRLFQPLRVLVRSIAATLKGLTYTILLHLIVIYSFGVVFTQAAKDSTSNSMSIGMDRYFGSLLKSILTLFQSVTNGVDWDEVYEPLEEEHWAYGCLFLLYFVLAFFAVLNVMTALFCQAAIESVKKDHEEVIAEQLANKTRYVSKLEQLFASLAGGNENLFTLATFEENMSNERMEAYFQSLDIKITDAWKLFRLLLDEDEDHVDMDRFVQGCLELRGPATTIDLRDLASEVHWVAKHIDKMMAQLSDSQVATKADVSRLMMSIAPGCCEGRESHICM